MTTILDSPSPLRVLRELDYRPDAHPRHAERGASARAPPRRRRIVPEQRGAACHPPPDRHARRERSGPLIASAGPRLEDSNGLARASHAELCKFHGFGEAKASQLLAAIELGKRISGLRGTDRPTVHSPQDVAGLVTAEMAFLDKEHFRVLVLDTKNHVLAWPDVFVGSVNSTTIRTAEVFREAVRRNASGVIVVHNHPSGAPRSA